MRGGGTESVVCASFVYIHHLVCLYGKALKSLLSSNTATPCLSKLTSRFLDCTLSSAPSKNGLWDEPDLWPAKIPYISKDGFATIEVPPAPSLPASSVSSVVQPPTKLLQENSTSARSKRVGEAHQVFRCQEEGFPVVSP
ncbi:hypothetical protein HDV00_010859 [Rhizophlyctis rosea]|nr:hypothetical protein HDV00_010859 [Rhizophlyctis rosea]